jgi:hypothetical protein
LEDGEITRLQSLPEKGRHRSECYCVARQNIPNIGNILSQANELRRLRRGGLMGCLVLQGRSQHIINAASSGRGILHNEFQNMYPIVGKLWIKAIACMRDTRLGSPKALNIFCEDLEILTQKN